MLTKGWPSSYPQAVQTCKVLRPHCRHPFPAMMIISMISKLGQRLHLSWDGPSESMELKRIGGSLGSDSEALPLKTITTTQPVGSGPDFATSLSCSHFCVPREEQKIPSSQRSKTGTSLLRVRHTNEGSKEPKKARGQY